MSVKRYKSDAKNKLVDMLVTLKDSDEGEFVLSVDGNAQDAEKFVHRMRVELSRFRKLNAQNNRMNKPFKILMVNCEEHQNGTTTVVLKKSMKGVDVFEGVAEVFDVIGLGGKVQ